MVGLPPHRPHPARHRRTCLFSHPQKSTALPIETMEARALRELEEARPGLREGNAREFSLRISEILRIYMEARFSLPVVQRTTEEFLLHLRRSSPPDLSPHLEQLDRFLNLCDQAKFAREPLTLSEMETMWLSAQAFIHQTSTATDIQPEASAPSPT
ncbi:MAG: hypothetical protein HC904_15100 [Blastochloris sp.]|nr:hypothetical protein [Blastochloris sp.]